ncbi:ABC-2 family transporter protein [Clostridium tepidiprofundi DSM 19306]|uniref:ABC-2 family transporter protein n=1 Tax=Clostridium tepidiprofundi DSM 19306 TaxID=1121338 RepID=A0A151B2Q1_9CLOT|nr:ABC transporter permease [Clostridium tepidiprofundi]KYH34188.1 ABC-2 family transporter protein [Clostridium tepidiprofundi DSM 19306]
MITLIKLELRKILFKKRILLALTGSLFLSFISIRAFSLKETYADIFSKSYGLVPLMGLIMFMMFSGSYTAEYNSNMSVLIKTTKNGKKEIVLAKSIAAGLGATITNLLIFLTVCLSALTKYKFSGLNLPIKSLWYFDKCTSNITVIQMIFIMILTITIWSFFFAQIGLFLSSISNSATIPFIFGGLIMGIPYLLEGFLKGIGFAKYLSFTPLWGMMSCQLVRYKTTSLTFIILTIIFLLGTILLPRFTLKAFVKE